jgi:hypothetical protein
MSPTDPLRPPPLVERLPEPAQPERKKPDAAQSAAEREARLNRPRATPSQIAEAENHLRQANLLRIRGELKQSLAELVKAMEANPYDPTPHLLSAESLRNVGRPDDAIAAYEHAIELSPSGPARNAAEAKLARLVMEQNELNSTDRPFGENSSQPVDRSRLPIIAGSVIVPGLGQWIAGSQVKAVIIFVLWLSSFAVVPLITRSAGSGVGDRMMIGAVPSVLIWVFAVIDAYIEAGRAAGKS